MTRESILSLIAHIAQMGESVNQRVGDFLDLAVYDMTCEKSTEELASATNPDEQEEIISSAEELASQINSGGVEEQVDYLLANGYCSNDLIDDIKRCQN